MTEAEARALYESVRDGRAVSYDEASFVYSRLLTMAQAVDSFVNRMESHWLRKAAHEAMRKAGVRRVTTFEIGPEFTNPNPGIPAATFLFVRGEFHGDGIAPAPAGVAFSHRWEWLPKS